MATRDDFGSVFARLREILVPYSSKLVVAADSDREYYLNTTAVVRKRPILFAGVSSGKTYVSFHLMPVYAFPELLTTMSSELKKRMQGKACFNFREVDEKLFREPAKLTGAGFARFKTLRYL